MNHPREAAPPLAEDAVRLPLHAERVSVSRRRIETLVRVQRLTRTRQQPVDETLTQQAVEIVRVPIGRMVDLAPPVREEAGTTIISIVEEVVVVERRLRLKEEVHIRLTTTHARHAETVALREQDVVITRTELPARNQPARPPAPGVNDPETPKDPSP